MMDYQAEKQRAREKAIDIQNYLSEHEVSWMELAQIQEECERLGRRYGLLKEFRENGLC